MPEADETPDLNVNVTKTGGRWVMQRFCTGNGCVWRRVWVNN